MVTGKYLNSNLIEFVYFYSVSSCFHQVVRIYIWEDVYRWAGRVHCCRCHCRCHWDSQPTQNSNSTLSFPLRKAPYRVQILKRCLVWFCFSWQIKEWAILVINAQIWKLSTSQSVYCCLMKVSFSSQRSVKVVALIWLTLRT